MKWFFSIIFSNQKTQNFEFCCVFETLLTFMNWFFSFLFSLTDQGCWNHEFHCVLRPSMLKRLVCTAFERFRSGDDSGRANTRTRPRSNTNTRTRPQTRGLRTNTRTRLRRVAFSPYALAHESLSTSDGASWLTTHLRALTRIMSHDSCSNTTEIVEKLYDRSQSASESQPARTSQPARQEPINQS